MASQGQSHLQPAAPRVVVTKRAVELEANRDDAWVSDNSAGDEVETAANPFRAQAPR